MLLPRDDGAVLGEQEDSNIPIAYQETIPDLHYCFQKS